MKPFRQAFHLLHKQSWKRLKNRSEAFEGFEGYYYKISDRQGQVTVFIVGICKRKDEAFSFLQVANHKSATPQLYKYPLSALIASQTDVSFQLGNNQFSADGIYINEKDCSIDLTFHTVSPWKRTIINPSIMGPLAYVPGVECKHDIIASHLYATGDCRMGAEKIHFHQADGYIDKNWGTSFPSSYYWGHAHAFTSSNLSVQFAKGKPKWGPIQPAVNVGFMRLNNNIITFSSHNGGKIYLQNPSDKRTLVVLENRKWKIELNIHNAATTPLYAPHEGSLNQSIHESIGGYSALTVFRKQRAKSLNKVLKDHSQSTTFERHNWVAKTPEKHNNL